MTPLQPAQARIAGGDARLPRLIVSLGVANVALFTVYMGVLQLLLPAQLERIDPANKVQLFGMVASLGAVAAALANPIAGALSDATRSRHGRRTPWLLGAGFAAPASLLLLGSMKTASAVAFGWCLVQAVMNCFHAAIAAILPDRVPARRRGVASAVIGLGLPLGIAFGTAIAAWRMDDLRIGYGLIGVIFTFAAVAFVFANPDRAMAQAARPLRSFAGFFSAFRHADFRWTFISRFLVNLAYSTSTAYQLYLLQDYVTLRADQHPAQILVMINTLSMIAMVFATLTAGWASDVTRRRRLFVSGSALLLALGALAPVLMPTVTGMIILGVVNGLGMGCYLAVDAALVTQVLPDAENNARDLGVFNIANAGPQVVGPILASVWVAWLGGYAAMLAYGGAMALISAFAILKVRGVR
jgi:MFS family permease